MDIGEMVGAIMLVAAAVIYIMGIAANNLKHHESCKAAEEAKDDED